MSETATGTVDSGSGTQPDPRAAAHEAKEAGGRVAGTAKEGASRVGHEAKSQLRSLADTTTSELREQAGQQQQRAASGIRSVGDELRGMAANSEQQGVASEVVQQVADRAASVADWLDARDPGSLLNEVKQFARQRPGAFIAIAAGAGLLVGRLTRALVDSNRDSDDDSGATGGVTGSAGTTGTAPLAGTTEAPFVAPATDAAAGSVAPTTTLGGPSTLGGPTGTASAGGGSSTVLP